MTDEELEALIAIEEWRRTPEGLAEEARLDAEIEAHLREMKEVDAKIEALLRGSIAPNINNEDV